MTTREVAQRYGITIGRVLALARARGVRPTQIVAGRFTWSLAAAERLRPHRPGRPRKKQSAVGGDGEE